MGYRQSKPIEPPTPIETEPTETRIELPEAPPELKPAMHSVGFYFDRKAPYLHIYNQSQLILHHLDHIVTVGLIASKHSLWLVLQLLENEGPLYTPLHPFDYPTIHAELTGGVPSWVRIQHATLLLLFNTDRFDIPGISLRSMQENVPFDERTKDTGNALLQLQLQPRNTEAFFQKSIVLSLSIPIQEVAISTFTAYR